MRTLLRTIYYAVIVGVGIDVFFLAWFYGESHLGLTRGPARLLAAGVAVAATLLTWALAAGSRSVWRRRMPGWRAQAPLTVSRSPTAQRPLSAAAAGGSELDEETADDADDRWRADSEAEPAIDATVNFVFGYEARGPGAPPRTAKRRPDPVAEPVADHQPEPADPPATPHKANVDEAVDLGEAVNVDEAVDVTAVDEPDAEGEPGGEGEDEGDASDNTGGRPIGWAFDTAELAHVEARPAIDQDDPGLIRARAELAGARWANGEIEAAIPLYEQTVADAARVLGEDDLDTLEWCCDLAAAYEQDGRLDDAITMYTRALAGRERRLGMQHPDCKITRSSLAVALTVRANLQRGRSVDAG